MASMDRQLPVAKLAQIGAVVVGTLYVVGFLVVTFHLSEFGVTPATLLRPQYLVAGIWCLIPLVLFIAAFAFAALQFAEPWIRGSVVVPRSTRIYRHIIGGFQGAVGLVCSFTFIAFGIGKLLGISRPFGVARYAVLITVTLAILSLLVAGTGFFAVKWSLALLKERDPNRLRIDRLVTTTSVTALTAFVCLAFAIMYVRHFSVRVYSGIPASIGGGKPQTVVSLLDPSAKSSPPLALDRSGTRSVPYSLLLRTESSYIVQSPVDGENAIEFRQESVRGMIVLKP